MNHSLANRNSRVAFYYYIDKMKIRNIIIVVLILTNLAAIGYAMLQGQRTIRMRDMMHAIKEQSITNAELVHHLSSELDKIVDGDSVAFSDAEISALELLSQSITKSNDSLAYVLASAQLEREYWQTRALECDSTLSAN